MNKPGIITQPHKVLLSLGANLGDSQSTILKAVNILVEDLIIGDIKLSSFYRSEPVGYKDQDWFVNAAITGMTNLIPIELFDACKSIELVLGRKHREKWHQREIDIDIILFGEEVVDTESLLIPHPRMHERRFVLLPSAEIAPDMKHPIYNMKITQLLNQCSDTSTVQRID